MISVYCRKFSQKESFMPLKIQKINIEKLFGYKDIKLNTKDITVLVGKNGLGKTTILKIINALLSGNNDAPELNLCDRASIIFSNQSEIVYDNIQSSFHIDSEPAIKAFEVMLERLVKEKNISKDDIDNGIRLRIESEEQKKYKFEIQYTPSKDIEHQWQIFNTKKEIVSTPNTTLESVNKHSDICYISTLNLSANSLLDIDFGDGTEKNILNLQLDIELDRLKHGSTKFIQRFIDTTSALLRDSNKSLLIENDDFTTIEHSNNQRLSIGKLSSGEKQLLYILAKIANTKGRNTFLLMDEPEISLHLNWQEQLLKNIKNINENCQVLVVTHSPAIIMNGYMDTMIDMRDISTGVKNG